MTRNKLAKRSFPRVAYINFIDDYVKIYLSDRSLKYLLIRGTSHPT